MSTQTIQCPLCDHEARLVTARQDINVGRRKVQIDDEYMHCDACEESFYTPGQSERVQTLAKKEAEKKANLLEPDQLEEIRKSFNMTQAEFDELLGVGPKSSARWENGHVKQNVATDRLIRLLAADRKNVQILAGINGVALRDSCFVPDVSMPGVALAGMDFLSMPDFPADPPFVAGLSGSFEMPLLSKTSTEWLASVAKRKAQ
jgi:putative zinc finger/helix-turn-helix YgiT family protein